MIFRVASGDWGEETTTFGEGGHVGVLMCAKKVCVGWLRRFFACIAPGRMMAETGAGRCAWRPECHTGDGDGVLCLRLAMVLWADGSL